MAVDWITTPLESGAIPANHYSCTIGSLLASTIYEYRAYMTIGGVPYYGETCTITTSGTPTLIPTVSTGTAGDITLSSMRITGSTVDTKGAPSTILEYGVLYSQSPSTNLIYGGAGVNKQSIIADIGTNVEFFTDGSHDLYGLLNNTVTYYRAFAKNATGVGYGVINTQQTLAPTQKGIYLIGQYVTCTDGKVLASAQLSVDNFNYPDSFRLCFTDSACSLGSSVRPMCACSYYTVTGSPTKNVCASTLVPDYTSPAQIVDLSGYIDVNAGNINDYTFYTMACSHPSNFTVYYTNCACIQLGGIVNEVGGSYYLPDPASSYMGVHTTSVTCPAGGHIPQIT